MTREEAANWFEAFMLDYHDPMEVPDDLPYEVAEVALSALRPVSREMVEKMWRGKWNRHYKSGIHAGNGVVCSKCDMWNNRAAHFCPSCGAPMTDEAVEMVIERWEALKDGKGD